MRPPNAKLIKRAFTICSPTRTMRPPSAMIAMLKSAHKNEEITLKHGVALVRARPNTQSLYWRVKFSQ